MISLPPRFWRYFLIASALLLAGIMLAIVQAFLASPHVIPLDPAGLAARAGYHRDTVMPFLAAAFPRLLFLNAGVALFILIVPLAWAGVWWFCRDLRDAASSAMYGTAGLLMVALGHNSFSKIGITARLLPWPVVASLYIPHGMPEMLAFVLAGSSAFLIAGDLGKFMQEHGTATIHPGELCLFILGRAAKPGLAIAAIMAIAAAIECWVTPGLVMAAYNAALGIG